jgi:hypothetical protein
LDWNISLSVIEEQHAFLLKPLKTSSSFKPVYLRTKTWINFLGLILATVFLPIILITFILLLKLYSSLLHWCFYTENRGHHHC